MGRIAIANLPYKTKVTGGVILSRFFATRTGYKQVIKYSRITKWLQKHEWQAHHWCIASSKGKAGSEGLRRNTKAGWNLVPLSAEWNRVIGNGGLGFNATRLLVGASPGFAYYIGIQFGYLGYHFLGHLSLRSVGGSSGGNLTVTSKSSPAISVRSIELSAQARATVWKVLRRQARVDVTFIFPIFCCFGFGLAGIADLVWPGDFSPFHTAVITIGCGILASIGMLLVHASAWRLIREDLKAGVGIEASVSCERALSVRVADSSLDGVALDCGDGVLVLLGSWWLSTIQTEIWSDPKSRKKFPARKFRIAFLPRSGKVFAVTILSGRVSVEEPDPVEPAISINCSKFAEVVYVAQTLRSLIVPGGSSFPDRATPEIELEVER